MRPPSQFAPYLQKYEASKVNVVHTPARTQKHLACIHVLKTASSVLLEEKHHNQGKRKQKCCVQERQYIHQQPASLYFFQSYRYQIYMDLAVLQLICHFLPEICVCTLYHVKQCIFAVLIVICLFLHASKSNISQIRAME